MNMRARQNGVALLVALLAVALAVIMASSLIDHGEQGRARLRNQWRAEQSAELMRGLEAWAVQAILADQRASPDFDPLDAPWRQPLPPITVPGAVITGQLRDLGACFNLNALAADGSTDEVAVRRLQRVLIGLNLETRIANQAADYVDRDREVQDNGAEDNAYAALRPAARSANRPFTDISELKRLPAVDARVYAALAPYVCAAPVDAQFNLNSAPPVLWLSVADGMDLAQARRLAREPGTAYRSIEAVREALQREGINNADLGPFSLGSNAYQVQAQIDADGLVFDYSSVLMRTPGKVQVLARVRGRL
jgi:general secretion pathway protein K